MTELYQYVTPRIELPRSTCYVELRPFHFLFSFSHLSPKFVNGALVVGSIELAGPGLLGSRKVEHGRLCPRLARKGPTKEPFLHLFQRSGGSVPRISQFSLKLTRFSSKIEVTSSLLDPRKTQVRSSSRMMSQTSTMSSSSRHRQNVISLFAIYYLSLSNFVSYH